MMVRREGGGPAHEKCQLDAGGDGQEIQSTLKRSYGAVCTVDGVHDGGGGRVLIVADADRSGLFIWQLVGSNQRFYAPPAAKGSNSERRLRRF